MKTKLISGDEVAAITSERKHLNWKPGQRKAIKTKVNRRARREGKIRSW